YIYRQFARCAQKTFNRFHVREKLPFVVGCAPPVDVVATHGWLERRGLPFSQRFGRLDIVMSVDQHRWTCPSTHPFAIHERVTLGGYQVDPLQTDLAQVVRQPCGAAFQVARMSRLRAHARKTDKGPQFLNEAMAAGCGESEDSIHNLHPILRERCTPWPVCSIQLEISFSAVSVKRTTKFALASGARVAAVARPSIFRKPFHRIQTGLPDIPGARSCLTRISSNFVPSCPGSTMLSNDIQGTDAQSEAVQSLSSLWVMGRP